MEISLLLKRNKEEKYGKAWDSDHLGPPLDSPDTTYPFFLFYIQIEDSLENPGRNLPLAILFSTRRLLL